MSTDTLAAVAQQRAVLSTIADVIVAVAHGKSLRVAIHCDHRDDHAFVDRLAQALLARGRDCRCPPTTRGPGTTDHAGPEGRAGAHRIAMIISGPADPVDTTPCRIDVQLNTVDRPHGPSGAERGPDFDEEDRAGTCHNRDSDIVVDYLANTGPVIRHLASWLAPATPG